MINKFQQGGKQEEAIMQFVQGLAQELQADPKQVIQAAQQNPKALEVAVQTFQQTKDMKQAAQAFAQVAQQQTQAARHGAKLNYLKSLKHQCAEDEEVYYYKKGGSVGCGCRKKEEGGELKDKKTKVVDNFKSKRQQNINPNDTVHLPNKEPRSLTGKPIKNIKPLSKEEYRKLPLKDKDKVDFKDAERGRQTFKCGSKMKLKKNACGSKVTKESCGSKVVKKFKAACGKKMKKHEQGGSLNRIPFIKMGLLKKK